MVTAADSLAERRKFYSKATHILFAIVLGQSFLLFPDDLIPLHAALEPKNHMVALVVAFSYMVIVMGWIGYARSISRHPHQDTGLGVVRFTINILIIFGYFYLLRISQTEVVADISLVMVALFGLYWLWDLIKEREYGSQYKEQFRRRREITSITFVVSILFFSVRWFIGIDVVNIVLFTVLVLGFSAAKWRPDPNPQSRQD